VAKKDYYEVLGVQRECTLEEVKLAYKKLARKYHPDVADDKAEAEVRFREINEAYAVLSDGEKRTMYDRYGTVDGPGNPFGGGGSPFGGGFGGFVDLADIFESVFGMGGGGAPRGRRPQRGQDLKETLELTLEEVLSGVEKELQVNTYDECGTCQGSGARPGTAPQTCSACQGTGVLKHVVRTQFGQVVRSGPCAACGGQGRTISDPCAECKGKGHVFHKKRVAVKVPPGVEEGNYIRLSNLGDQGLNGGPPGDLFVVLEVKPHEVFTREGDDLHVQQMITFTDAALGSEIEVPTLDGSPARMKIPAGTQSHTTFKIRGKGLPSTRSARRGDLAVQVIVMVPTQLNDKQKQLLKEYAGAGSQEAHGHNGRSWFGRIVDAILG
jgi:molecular chaperone DnaJ